MDSFIHHVDEKTTLRLIGIEDVREGLHYCIRYKERIAGLIAYHRIDEINKITELGYWLGQSFQGKGIMTHCCRVLTEYAFGQFNLHRVEILAADGNKRSWAIPERLGFTKEGTLREVEWVNDRYLNNVVYSMLQQDWSNSDE